MSYLDANSPRSVAVWFESSTSGGTVSKGVVTNYDASDVNLPWEVTYDSPTESIWYSELDLLDILVPVKGEWVEWLEYDERYVAKVERVEPKFGDRFNLEQYKFEWRNVKKKQCGE